jgi:hypothetical protein
MIMLPSEQRLVQELIDRIALFEQTQPESWQWAKLTSYLEDLYGEEPVRWAIRFFDALKVAEERRLDAAGTGPLWDRELDGEVKSNGLSE